MNFFAPSLLIGLAAAAIPPIIHLIHRRRAKVVRFAALEFVHRSNRKTARRFRIKQILLMAIRSALLAAVAFAVARPYLSHQEEALAASLQGRGITIIVVDATYPMAYELDGERLIDRARLLAGQILDNLGGEGQAALTVAGKRVEVPLSDPTRDLTAVRRALDAIEPGFHFGNLSEAVARAYELLENQPAGLERRVVVLTTGAGVASALPPPPTGTFGGQPTVLLPVDVSSGRSLDNRAVLDVSLRPAPELGAGQWRIDARVGNYGAAAAKVPIAFEVDGAPLVRGFVDLAAGEVVSKTFHARLDNDQSAEAAVVLEQDSLPLDDRRAFWVEPAPVLRILALNGDPRPIRQHDEFFYLERALAPRIATSAQVKLTVADRDTIDRYDFSDFEVVILGNYLDLSREQTRLLVAYVQGGGGLLIAVGDKVDPERANRALVDLLPRQLRDVRVSGDAAASDEGGDRRAAHPTVFNRGHPILSPFADPAATSLTKARIQRYMLLDPSPDAGGEIVITLDEGAPLLLTRVIGRGRVALLTTSIDRDWGDLPIRPDFLPLLQQTLRYLTQVSDVQTAPFVVGATAEIRVDDDRVQRVLVKGPDGAQHALERPIKHAQEGPWPFEEAATPGHYRLVPDPPLPGLTAIPGFAVAVDPAGAELRGKMVGESTNAVDGRTSPERALLARTRTELWHGALAGLFLLLAAEAGLLFKRRRQVRSDA